jgi:ribosomal protein S27AE
MATRRYYGTLLSQLGPATEHRPNKLMPKRKFIEEDDGDTGYVDAECPECGGVINAHFHPGRNWRRLQCPVCHRQVIISVEKQESPLIQLGRAGIE